MNLIESSQHAEIHYSHFIDKDTKTQEELSSTYVVCTWWVVGLDFKPELSD